MVFKKGICINYFHRIKIKKNFILQGSRKRPRLDKGHENPDVEIKKDDDIKMEVKG